MVQLTQEKCFEIIFELEKQQKVGCISIGGEYSLQAFKNSLTLMKIMNGHLNVIAEVVAERQRQIEKGYNAGNDDNYNYPEMAGAAACYARHVQGRSWVFKRNPEDYKGEIAPDSWPWDEEIWKPKSPREDLVRAAALIVAEIERYDRNEGLENSAE